jgi:hypothetical protein
MFNVDIERKRVVIAHTVQSLDGPVDLKTTVDLFDVPDEKVLLWAATNRLTRWLSSLEIGKISSADVKMQFDNLVIECREYFRSNVQPSSREERILVDDFRRLLGKGLSLDQVLQSLIRGTLRLGH